jgi:hypothetical protein
MTKNELFAIKESATYIFGLLTGGSDAHGAVHSLSQLTNHLRNDPDARSIVSNADAIIGYVNAEQREAAIVHAGELIRVTEGLIGLRQ